MGEEERGMFTITCIQAEYGDSLLISYGFSPQTLRHVLIDGGTGDTVTNLIAVLDQHRTDGSIRLEALVITHYDFDHIGGVIALLSAPPPWLEIADVWFNGRKQLFRRDVLGPAEGDYLTKQIDGYYPWNFAFGGKTIKSDVAPVTLAGGLKVWVVSPDQTRINKLATKWPVGRDEVDKPADKLGPKDVWPPGNFATVASQKFEKDESIANGSSIALMLGFDDRLALLTGDAHPDVVVNGLAMHWPGSRPKVSLLKLSHHGSKGNTSEQLLKAIDCSRYLVSTNGDRFKHPDIATFARILKVRNKATFLFNYTVDRTLWWKEVPEGWPRFSCVYPESGAFYTRITL